MTSFRDEADSYFDGPVDDYGQPKVGNDPLDVEVKFSKEGPTMYRWFWDSPTKGTYTGPWRESRVQAFDEGNRWLQTGRL